MLIRQLPANVHRVILLRTREFYDILPGQRRGGDLRAKGPYWPSTTLNHACRVKPVYKWKDVFG